MANSNSEMRNFKSCRPRLEVFSEFDSEMQWFEILPPQPASQSLTHTE